VVPVGAEDPPAQNSSPCAVDAGDGGTLVAWTTASGSVRAAVRRVGNAGAPLPAWTVAWTVAPRGAASLNSRISASSGEQSLYWVGEDGRVKVADFVERGTETKNAGMGYWAMWKHDVNVGGIREIVALKVDEAGESKGAVRLFWVGGGSGVWTMR